MLLEESEEVIVLSSSETTERAGRAGPLLQPSSARGSGTRHARKGQPHPFEPARPLQRTRYQAAKRRRHRRFHARYDRMFRPDMRWRAWREVRANGGSAGIDAVQRDDVERQGVTTLLQALAQDLRAGSDRPQPVRRVSIPKPDGRQRPLGMPTVRDRVVHTGVQDRDRAACLKPTCKTLPTVFARSGALPKRSRSSTNHSYRMGRWLRSISKASLTR